jgi:hypothetical protein
MKLIVVQRSKTATFDRLRKQFADNPDVRVVWDRRASVTDVGGPASASRRLRKSFNRQGYFVVYTADDESVHRRPRST